MKTCQNCGNLVNEYAEYCHVCGQKMEQESFGSALLGVLLTLSQPALGIIAYLLLKEKRPRMCQAIKETLYLVFTLWLIMTVLFMMAMIF